MKKSRNTKRAPHIEVCSDCANDDVSRRSFLRTVGGTLAASAALPSLGRAIAKDSKPAETYVKILYDSLTEKQRKVVHFPFGHELATQVKNNWNIVDPKVASIGTFYTSDQQDLIRHILKGITSEDGYRRFHKQMTDDAGGFEKYTCALFGDPGQDRFEWVLTGRHLTLRADGNSFENAAFGGPIFYGHAVQFEEEAHHPGNVWWYQGQLANELFGMLDGKQRAKALIDGAAPPDEAEAVHLQGSKAKLPGLAGAELSADQKGLLRSTVRSLFSMFRTSDVAEAVQCIETNGGFDALHLNFYKEEDIGKDGVWDRWSIQGPAFVWYFRGSPHVHTWVNVGHRGAGDAPVRVS